MIERHNAVCQVVHATIRETSKEGGALHTVPGLVVVDANNGKRPANMEENVNSLCSDTPADSNHYLGDLYTEEDWLSPFPPPVDIFDGSHTWVFMDPRHPLPYRVSTSGNAECMAAPSRISHRFLPTEVTQTLFDVEHGTTLDLIYVRWVPDTLSSDPT